MINALLTIFLLSLIDFDKLAAVVLIWPNESLSAPFPKSFELPIAAKSSLMQLATRASCYPNSVDEAVDSNFPGDVDLAKFVHLWMACL